jgi:hypothetical protein
MPHAGASVNPAASQLRALRQSHCASPSGFCVRCPGRFRLYLVRLLVTCCDLEHEARTLAATRQCNSSHFPQTTNLYCHPSLNSQMSNTRTASTSSSNFQLIFNHALKAYERRTKKDLLAHPLAAQLQDCNSHSSVLTVLQQQVQELNQSQSNDERLTKWLDPTVNVLYTLSETLGEGVSLVCPVISKCQSSVLIVVLQVFSPAKAIFAGIGVLLSVCILFNTFVRSMVIRTALRQPRMLGRAKTLFLRCSSA